MKALLNAPAGKTGFPYKKILTYALQVIVLGLLAWFLYQNQDAFDSLKNIRWQQIIWIVLLDTASFLVGSYLNYSMIQRFDPRVTFLDCFLLQYVNNFLNKILPTIGGGAAFRAIYLKQKYRFPYTQFTSTVAGIYVISFSSTALVGIFCLLVIYARFQVFNWILFLAFAGILAACLFIIVYSPQIPPSNRRLLRVMKGVVDGWNLLKRDPKVVILYTFISMVYLVLSALHLLIGYQALGIQTNLIPMLFLSSLGIILAFVNFTPDGIGIKEGIFVFSKNLVRIPQDVLVLGSLVLRGISLVSTFIVGGICYLILMRRFKALDAGETLPADDPVIKGQP